MGTKKIQISFELTTEKEWREFIHRPGLVVVDLYRDWAGPCMAMATPLKNLKTSEAAFAWMQLGQAPSSIVPDLKRLQGSRPTFLLLSGGRLINVIFGCRAPDVIRAIQEEIEREKRVAAGLEKRKTLSLTRLTPAEVAMEEGALGSEGARLRAELDEARLKADLVLRRILGQIAGHLPATTIVVVFPYALQSEACHEILDALRETWAQQGIAVTRELELELGQEAVELMFWERRLPQHDVLAESVTQGPSLVLMLERSEADDEEEDEEQADEEDEEEEQRPAAPGVETVVAKSIYGFLPGTGSSMELITPAESASPAAEEADEDALQPEADAEADGEDEEEDEGVEHEEAEGEQADMDEGEGAEMEDEEEGNEEDQGEQGEQEDEGEEEQAAEQETDGECEDEGWEDGDEEYEDDDEDLIPQPEVRVWNPRELLPALDSAAARLLFRRDEKGPVLPGIWTPLSALSKAAAVKALFEDVAEPLFDPPTPPPPPPPESTVICFSGDKRDEVLQLSEAFPDDVTRSGFFTKSRKLLASTRPDYEKLVRGGLQTAKTLVVLEVTRTRSAPLLELATAGPLYISATPGIAKADVDEFFGDKCVVADKDDLQEIVKVHEEEEEEYAAPVKKRGPRGPAAEDAAAEDGAQPAEAAEGEQGVEQPADEQQPVGEVLPEAGEGLGVGQDVGEAAPEQALEAPGEEVMSTVGDAGDAPAAEAAAGDAEAAAAEE